VIDIYSRYDWALPLKSKRGEEVKDLFVELFKEAKLHNCFKAASTEH
jgi:hypothetical protein